MPPSSDINVPCPGCRISYQVPAVLAGAFVTCEACGTDFILPEGNQSAGTTASAPLPPPAPLHRPAGGGTDRLPGGSSAPSEDSNSESIPTREALENRPPTHGPEATLQQPAPPRPRRHSFYRSAFLVLLGAGLVVGVSQFLPSPAASGDAVDPVDSVLPQAGNEKSDRAAAPLPVITVTPRRREPHRVATSAPPAPAVETVLPPPSPPVLKADAPATAPVPEVGEAETGPDISPPSPAAGDPEDPPPAHPADPAVPASPSPPATPVPVAAPPLPSPAEALEALPDPAVIRKDSRKTLERFFKSATLDERLAYSLNPARVRAEMEAHYRTFPIAPVALEGLALLTEGTLPGNERIFHLYNAFVQDQLAPIPMAVEQTPDGFRVDWQTFTECHSGKLKKFFAEPGAPARRFRVVLRRAHYFGPPVPGQDTDRLAYTVEPPTREESWPVWANRNSKVYQKDLATGERSTWDAESYAIVELAWSGGGEDGRWVTLTKILADSWRPE